MRHLFGHLSPCLFAFALGKANRTFGELIDHVIVSVYEFGEFFSWGVKINFLIGRAQSGLGDFVADFLQRFGDKTRYNIGQYDRHAEDEQIYLHQSREEVL